MSSLLLIIHLLTSSVAVTSHQYSLLKSYTGSSFFDGFSFDTYDDPTHGYVDYVDSPSAFSLGMVNVTENGQIYMGVDSSTVPADGDRGRKSVRITSTDVFNGNNLIIIDLEHMPSTAASSWLPAGCSVWPAFWTVGPDWPYNGEIDIIEYANSDSMDTTTLHTSDGCEQSSEDTSTFTGTWSTGSQNNPADDCSVYAYDQWSNQGCGITGTSQRVGAAFNAIQGGVYALEWVSDEYIRAFFFERGNIPSDLLQLQETAHSANHSDSMSASVPTAPQPDTWGTPYARFELKDDSCPSWHFQDHRIVFDTTFCGDWAGSTFASMCTYDVSCNDYVRYNPSDFSEAYWLVNYVAVYSLAY